MDRHKISRREFLYAGAAAAAGTALAACQPQTIIVETEKEVTKVVEKEVEKVVKETVVVEKEVEKEVTKVVEKEKLVEIEKVVTATPVPPENESPVLQRMVEAGQLPPLEDRVPQEPFVIEGLDGIGNFGGTMRKSFSGQADGGTISHMTNRGLININQDFVIHPYLAASWDVSDDAREYTFYLRRGLSWSDGAPMSAEDFDFYYTDEILNRELTPVHPEQLSSVIEGERVPAEFSTPDDFTVKYVFPEPKALFYFWGGVILNIPASPKHYRKEYHKDYADQAALDKMVTDRDLDDWTQLYGDMGNWRINVEFPLHRPWLPQNSWASEFVVAERNPYFWETDTVGNQLPYIDNVTYRVFQDKEVTLMWAANGEIDCQARHIYAFENYTILKENEARGDYKVQEWIKTKIHAMHFNMTTKDPRLRKLFSERDFRIATSLCLNRDEMRELLYDGFGTNMQYVPWPPDNPLYYSKLANVYLDYDPDRANELLDGLGYTDLDGEGYRLWNDGSGERISWTCLGSPDDAKNVMLIDYFKGIGLQLNFRSVERALSIEMHQSNEVQMTSGEADRNLIPLADPQIWIKYTNIDDRPWCNAWTAWYMNPDHPIAEEPPADHWIWDIWGYWEEIQKTAGEEEQKQLFWKILDIWAEELPSVGLFGDFPLLVVVKNGFKGIHDGYGWDCCTTVYEYVIDDATWYWDEPEKHTM
jgi:peptide/nickel transport system substrate-binding protein